jgi:hypothetical protein
MRRILLTNDQAFSATNDNNNLFFCASVTTTNGGDYIFGMLDTTFAITRAYRYGTSGSEVIGDCALTKDNEYLIGLFSSNYYHPRDASVPLIDTTGSASITLNSGIPSPI